MKKLKLLIMFAALFMLTACGNYGEKRIVKLVTVDKENISFYYYDFTQKEPAYVVEEKVNNGIENTMVQLLSENEYDLKLCSFVMCDKSIVSENMGELTSALLNSRFSPDVCIVEGDIEKDVEKYTDKTKTNYPLYSYNLTDSKINGIVENADSSEKHIIYKNEIYKTLNSRQSFAIDLINNITDKGVYTFEYDGQTLTANFENLNTFFSEENGYIKITISAILKNYKGMPANKISKEQFIGLLQYHLNKDILEIYSDSILVETLKLDWFRQLSEVAKIKTDIIIK